MASRFSTLNVFRQYLREPGDPPLKPTSKRAVFVGYFSAAAHDAPTGASQKTGVGVGAPLGSPARDQVRPRRLTRGGGRNSGRPVEKQTEDSQ